MTNRAATSSLIVVLFALSLPFAMWAAWSFYDGFISYPAQQERAEAYELLQQDYPEDWSVRWDERARAEGWPIKDPGPKRSNTDILTQYIMGGFCSFLALVCVGVGLLLIWLNKRSESQHVDDSTG
ncbi:MAG: hypothetical protein AAGH88_08055 [Planctomycetota bacterium]